MIPNGTFVHPPIVADFIPPGDQDYLPLHHVATGALELGDGNGGRLQQLWEVNYVAGEARIGKLGETYELAVPIAGVLAISLAFDSNMAEVLGYQTESGCSIRFFNPLLPGYDTLDVPEATSCRVVVDDPRVFNEGNSDVIFGYLRDSVLYYRQQRDRYMVEYEVGPANGVLIRLGMNLVHRLQFEIA